MTNRKATPERNYAINYLSSIGVKADQKTSDSALVSLIKKRNPDLHLDELAGKKFLSAFIEVTKEWGANSFEGNFYESDEWRSLRYKVLKDQGRKCVCCGAKPPNIMHVDHIKPRSKYPELELDFNNLQILCEDCNLGKSNTDEIDYRKKTKDPIVGLIKELDEVLLNEKMLDGAKFALVAARYADLLRVIKFNTEG